MVVRLDILCTSPCFQIQPFQQDNKKQRIYFTTRFIHPLPSLHFVHIPDKPVCNNVGVVEVVSYFLLSSLIPQLSIFPCYAH